MKISEIFHSIEGEGIEIGRPEIFIRLSNCNLRCTWCDTKYSWQNGKEMSVEEVMKEVAKYPCKSVSITGGEPLLQKDELLRLVKKLKASGYWIQVNTNGTIFDEEIFRLVNLITMDIKCTSSGMKSDLGVVVHTKKTFGSNRLQLKFVISNEEDYDYAKNIVLTLLNDMKNVIFQPEWKTREFTTELMKFVKRDGMDLRVILQQQKMVWGSKKGV